MLDHSLNAEILELAHPLSRALEALDRPASLCELNLSAEDYTWLLAWAEKIQPERLEQWLTLRRIHARYGCSPHEAVGLLLLLIASEIGRRHAQEGDLWRHVEERFGPAGGHLFTQGQPRLEVKRSLQAAAYRFQLHHAFGEDGTQAYYTTVFRQFGFTEHALARLPVWLASAEARPTGVRRLLECSEPFRRLWSALSKGETVASPFLLPGWEPARAVHYPRLSWSGHDEPCFLVDLATLLPSEEGTYELTLPGSEEPVWVFVTRGQFQPQQVAVLPSGPNVTLSYRRHDLESDLVHRDLCLWAVDEPVTFYALPGGARSQCRPGVAGILLAERHWTCKPPADSWRRLTGTPWALHRFAAGLQAGHELWDGDEKVWTLDSLAAPTLPALTLGHPQQLICVLPEEIGVRVDGLPPGAELISARHQERTLRVEGRACRVVLDNDLQEPRLRLRLGVRWEGRRYQRTVTSELEIEACTISRGQGWERFEYLEELDVQEARDAVVRFLLPDRPFGLVEGDLFLGRPGPLRLTGHGAPLRLLHGPYGLQEKLPRLLAESVVDRGWLRSASWTPAGGLELEVRQPFEPDPERQVVLWDGLNEPGLWPSSEFSVQGSRWSVPLDWEPAAVALVYAGRRLGAAWLHPLNWKASPHLAQAIRWFRLPVLQNALADRFRSMLEARPTLRDWLSDTAWGPLQHAESEGWLAVVRAFFGDWKPEEPELAREALKAVGYPALLSVSPLLAFRLLRDGLEGREHRELCQELLRLPANKQSPGERLAALAELRESTARGMGVAAPYLLALEGRLNQDRADDLLIALANPHFQHYLLARLMVRLAWSQ